jgi:hypothetical protein
MDISKHQELGRLQAGERVYQRVLPSLIKEGYTTMDRLPREEHAMWESVVLFKVPASKNIEPEQRNLLQDWLNNRSPKIGTNYA